MLPAVPPPPGLLRPVVELKLKPGWRYDAGRRVFAGARGKVCKPRGLPKGSRILPKVPHLAHADAKTLSPSERDLQRRVQLVLPRQGSAAAGLAVAREWPCVEEARLPPQISLPSAR